MRYQLIALACVLVVVPGVAFADNNMVTRCHNDQANAKEQSLGRNAWALKCGYIAAVDQAYGDATGKYATFADYDAPWDASAPCAPGKHVLGLCILAGCYTPDQRVMFSGEYIAVSDAALHRSVPTVTALGNDWQFAEFLPTVEEPLEHFVVGDESDPVLRVTTENGLSLEVTGGHPMVDSDGTIVEASAIVAGRTTLLTTAGPSLVRAVVSRPYNGKVWNIMPKSTATAANIHFAEGFVTGSIRFQNEWARDATRLQVRSRIDVDAF